MKKQILTIALLFITGLHGSQTIWPGINTEPTIILFCPKCKSTKPWNISPDNILIGFLKCATCDTTLERTKEPKPIIKPTTSNPIPLPIQPNTNESTQKPHQNDVNILFNDEIKELTSWQNVSAATGAVISIILISIALFKQTKSQKIKLALQQIKEANYILANYSPEKSIFKTKNLKQSLKNLQKSKKSLKSIKLRDSKIQALINDLKEKIKELQLIAPI
ncbi:MAG: hypothetical protein UR26_C0010G0013 [candidate division TM6 bacterium GW2011_GWF2_32_72]|nr:MAG: hypothetical protein UR26_C0010G0013 [candidate division TM6 bacterium GW2011_GWF2_32_72]